MAIDQLTIIASVLAGVIGVVTVGLSLVAYTRFRHTSYSRMLQPLIVVTVIFTVGHGLLLLWQKHPLVIDILESLTVTGIAIGVVRLIQLHPSLDGFSGSDRR